MYSVESGQTAPKKLFAHERICSGMSLIGVERNSPAHCDMNQEVLRGISLSSERRTIVRSSPATIATGPSDRSHKGDPTWGNFSRTHWP